MNQNGCRIGGEQSGHIIFSKYASTVDGNPDQSEDDGSHAG